jgi:hypothetical protein
MPSREQFRTLCLLVLVLLSIVFEPAIRWAIGAVSRGNIVNSSQVEVAVPRRWSATLDGSAVEAWIPCLTVFCSAPRSSLKIQIERTLAGNAETWLKRAENTLEERRYSSPMARGINSSAGRVQCLEARSEIRIGIVESVCFASESGLVASFDGLPSELQDFYLIVGSAQAVYRP